MIATKHKSAIPEPEPEEVKLILKPKKYSLRTQKAILVETFWTFFLKDRDQIIQAAVKQQFEKYQNSNTKSVPERIRKGSLNK